MPPPQSLAPRARPRAPAPAGEGVHPLCGLWLLTCAAGCAAPRPESNPPPVWRDCNVATEACILPFPSSVFERVDASQQTGLRIDLSGTADFGGVWKKLGATPHDGFSPASTIVTWLPGGGLAEDLPGDHDASTADSSPVLLLDADATAETWGQAHPFRADLVSTENAGDGALLVLTPLRALRPGGRYAVLVTDGLRQADGSAAAATDGMAAVVGRDEPEAGSGLRELHAYMADLVRLAADHEVSRDSIVQIWDFHVRSDEGITADLRSMAAQTEAWIVAQTADGAPPAPVLVSEGQEAGEQLRFDIEIDVPDWRNKRQRGRLQALNRDAGAQPAMTGVERLHGWLMIPPNATPENPAIPVIFGHGLGASADLMATTISNMDLARGPYAAMTVDWDLHGTRGDGLDDILAITGELEMQAFAGAVLQSVSDSLVLSAAAPFIPEIPERGVVVADGPVLYLGQSLGGLVGVMGAAVDPRLRASALNVTGGGMSGVLRHGEVIDTIGMRQALEAAAESDPPDGLPLAFGYDVLLALSQLGLDSADPLNFAPHVFSDRFSQADGPAVLVQESIGDGIMPNVMSETLARTMGLPLVEPTQRGVLGVGLAQAPTCGAPASGMTQFLVSDIPFVAHLAMEEEIVQEQILNWFASFHDAQGAWDGDIRYSTLDGTCP